MMHGLQKFNRFADGNARILGRRQIVLGQKIKQSLQIIRRAGC